MKRNNLLNIILLIILLSSCVSRVKKHGYMFELSDQDVLQVGVTSKDRLLKAMGSPTFISDLDDDQVWFYYSENVDRFLFFKPTIKTRNLMVVKFDKSDTIKELNNIDLLDGSNSLKFASDYTKVGNHKINFFKSLFGNVGQIKPQ